MLLLCTQRGLHLRQLGLGLHLRSLQLQRRQLRRHRLFAVSLAPQLLPLPLPRSHSAPASLHPRPRFRDPFSASTPRVYLGPDTVSLLRST